MQNLPYVWRKRETINSQLQLLDTGFFYSLCLKIHFWSELWYKGYSTLIQVTISKTAFCVKLHSIKILSPISGLCTKNVKHCRAFTIVGSADASCRWSNCLYEQWQIKQYLGNLFRKSNHVCNSIWCCQRFRN